MTILASGIDTLVLAVDVAWRDESVLDCLSKIKERAKAEDKERPSIMKGKRKGEEWVFSVMPYGVRGYEWLLTGKEFNMRIGKWIEPETRPSVMIEIGSETLWRKGPHEAVEKSLGVIEVNGGQLVAVKVSRADLCVDILLDDESWGNDLEGYLVTRGKKWNMWLSPKGLESLTVGTEEIRGRLYDKPLEIKQKSKKRWMYDIWKIKGIKGEKKVIRVEFQIRRTVLKELDAGEVNTFFMNCDRLWSYCTRKWLKFQTGKGKHHTQRKTLDWWKEVQDGFMGVQEAVPAIREKAIREDTEQLRAQILGLGSSLTALEMERRGSAISDWPGLEDGAEVVSAVIRRGKRNCQTTNREFQEAVIRKRARYARPLQ